MTCPRTRRTRPSLGEFPRVMLLQNREHSQAIANNLPRMKTVMCSDRCSTLKQPEPFQPGTTQTTGKPIPPGTNGKYQTSATCEPKGSEKGVGRRRCDLAQFVSSADSTSRVAGQRLGVFFMAQITDIQARSLSEWVCGVVMRPRTHSLAIRAYRYEQKHITALPVGEDT